ncbi:MAG TPA: hypothetical protein PL033_14340 [Candidatus Brocadiia bacterium]|nr:hypothetical protein [Candidatus Brocadiia bacterium]
MGGLLYREDIGEVRRWLTAWWNGDDMGRPALLLRAHRAQALEQVEEMPKPAGWVTHYSTSNYAYRVNCSARACLHGHYLAEAVPYAAPDLAPNCLALYLGCKGVETEDTVWCKECISDPDDARFVIDKDNFYWQFTLRLGAEQVRMGKGKFLVQFPDLIEGLDTLAAMVGTERLLFLLVERPDWVRNCLRQITDRYFYYYDVLYDMFRDEVGGSHYWAWAPGRMVKLQCDFSAMISPDMFKEFMVPVLTEMTERTSYSMYHWDGPGALCHLDALLSIPRLSMIQWTPGSGVEHVDDRRWWPYYHRIVDAGKKIYMNDCSSLDSLRALRREFGPKLNQFLIGRWCRCPEEAAETIRTAQE